MGSFFMPDVEKLFTIARSHQSDREKTSFNFVCRPNHHRNPKLEKMRLPYRIASLLLLLAFSWPVYSQPVTNPPAAIVLKTANTLLQARQYEAALENFKKALQQSKASRNNFQQAQAWEGLANVYTAMAQSTEAVVAYQNAIKLYRAQGYSVIADLLNTQMRQMLGLGDYHAGIEVGARGIKLTVLELKPGPGGLDYTLKMDSSINTDAATLSYQSEKETLDAIRLFTGLVQERWEIPANKISIAISSGLKQELDKYNKAAYFASMIRPKELDSKIKIEFITVEQEAELSFKGIVPQLKRANAGQMDVGSANSKGGYLDAAGNFVSVSFPAGTRTFQQLLEARIKGTPGMFDYRQAADKLIVDSLGRMLIYSLRDKNDFKSREIYLSGGIVWSIASLLYPEKIRQQEVMITLQDILDFQHMAVSDFETLSHPELSKSLSDEEAAATRANIKRVLETYDARALLAGSVWLGELVKQLTGNDLTKKMIFPRYAYVGWISGYILEQISRQYKGNAPK